MKSDFLEKLVKDNEIENRSICMFWKSFEDYKEEESNEFFQVFNNYIKEVLRISIKEISLTIMDWPECRRVNIITCIPVIYNNTEVGVYKAVYALTGEVEDDYLVIY